MKIIITMAGEGSRFKTAGYKKEKYELEYEGKTLFQHSLDSFANFKDEEFIYIVKNLAGEKYVKKNNPYKKYKIVNIDKKTSGQAETLYAFTKTIADSEILIFNIDSYIKKGVLNKSDIQGDMWWLTSQLPGNNWSFIDVKEDGTFRTSEKKRISKNASLGMYYFKHSDDFNKAFKDNRKSVISEFGEAYIAPFYNFIDGEMKIKNIENYLFEIIGTPKEYNDYSSKKISIAVQTYNPDQKIFNTVKSIINQSSDKFKLVIMDNGSTDQKYIMQIKEKFPFIRIVKNDSKNGGVAAGRNYITKIVDNDYLCRVDAYDEIEPDFIKKILKIIKKEETDIISIKDGRDTAGEKVVKSIFSAMLFSKNLDWNWGPTKFVMHRNVYKEVLFPEVKDGYYLEDTSCIYRALSIAKKPMKSQAKIIPHIADETSWLNTLNENTDGIIIEEQKTSNYWLNKQLSKESTIALENKVFESYMFSKKKIFSNAKVNNKFTINPFRLLARMKIKRMIKNENINN